MPRARAAHLTYIRHALKLAIYCENLNIKTQHGKVSLLTLYILWAIDREGQMGRTDIGRWLKRCKLSIHHGYVAQQTRIIDSLGFVVASRLNQGRVLRYSISVLGKQFLTDVEEATRRSRAPKLSLMKDAAKLSLGYYHRNRDKINEKRRKNPPTP